MLYFPTCFVVPLLNTSLKVLGIWQWGSGPRQSQCSPFLLVSMGRGPSQPSQSSSPGLILTHICWLMHQPGLSPSLSPQRCPVPGAGAALVPLAALLRAGAVGQALPPAQPSALGSHLPLWRKDNNQSNTASYLYYLIYISISIQIQLLIYIAVMAFPGNPQSGLLNDWVPVPLYIKSWDTNFTFDGSFRFNGSICVLSHCKYHEWQ